MEKLNIFKKILQNILKKLFNTSNYQLERPHLKGKEKNVIGMMKDKFGGNIMKEFVGLRSEIYSYLADDNDVNVKKQKVQKTCSKNKT